MKSKEGKKRKKKVLSTHEARSIADRRHMNRSARLLFYYYYYHYFYLLVFIFRSAFNFYLLRKWMC